MKDEIEGEMIAEVVSLLEDLGAVVPEEGEKVAEVVVDPVLPKIFF